MLAHCDFTVRDSGESTVSMALAHTFTGCALHLWNVPVDGRNTFKTVGLEFVIGIPTISKSASLKQQVVFPV